MLFNRYLKKGGNLRPTFIKEPVIKNPDEKICKLFRTYREIRDRKHKSKV